MTRYVIPGVGFRDYVPQPCEPTLNLLEPHPTWRERRRVRRELPESSVSTMWDCCPTLHTPTRWHFFAHECQGCGCPAEAHTLILVGHPCLDCATCPAYVPVSRPNNPSRPSC